MKASIVICALCATAAAASGQKDAVKASGDTAAALATAHPRVQMQTDLGLIVLELDSEKAPKSVANFLKYVDEKYYDGTLFHRIIPDFMIQGGGYTAIDQAKTVGLGSLIENESNNGLKNVRYAIAMARGTDPHSATSQFFINVVDNPRLDHQGDTRGYTVFGQVIEGTEVVDKIRSVECKPNPKRPQDKNSIPLNPPVIRSVTRVDASAASQPENDAKGGATGHEATRQRRNP